MFPLTEASVLIEKIWVSLFIHFLRSRLIISLIKSFRENCVQSSNFDCFCHGIRFSSDSSFVQLCCLVLIAIEISIFYSWLWFDNLFYVSLRNEYFFAENLVRRKLVFESLTWKSWNINVLTFHHNWSNFQLKRF